VEGPLLLRVKKAVRPNDGRVHLARARHYQTKAPSGRAKGVGGEELKKYQEREENRWAKAPNEYAGHREKK